MIEGSFGLFEYGLGLFCLGGERKADAGRPVLGIELGVWDEISKNPKKFEFYG